MLVLVLQASKPQGRTCNGDPWAEVLANRCMRSSGGVAGQDDSQSLCLVMEYCCHGTLQVRGRPLEGETPVLVVGRVDRTRARLALEFWSSTRRRPCGAEARIMHVRACADSDPEALVPGAPLGGQWPA